MQSCKPVTLCHPGLTYILISDIRALLRSVAAFDTVDRVI